MWQKLQGTQQAVSRSAEPHLVPRKVAHTLIDLPGNPALGGCKVGPALVHGNVTGTPCGPFSP